MASNILPTQMPLHLQLLTQAPVADYRASPLGCLSCHQLIVSTSGRPYSPKSIPSSTFPSLRSPRVESQALFSFDLVLPFLLRPVHHPFEMSYICSFNSISAAITWSWVLLDLLSFDHCGLPSASQIPTLPPLTADFLKTARFIILIPFPAQAFKDSPRLWMPS